MRKGLIALLALVSLIGVAGCGATEPSAKRAPSPQASATTAIDWASCRDVVGPFLDQIESAANTGPKAVQKALHQAPAVEAIADTRCSSALSKPVAEAVTDLGCLAVLVLDGQNGADVKTGKSCPKTVDTAVGYLSADLANARSVLAAN